MDVITKQYSGCFMTRLDYLYIGKYLNDIYENFISDYTQSKQQLFILNV